MRDPDFIPFTKMQGAGNDFIVMDNRKGTLTKEQIINLAPKMSNRKYGVGSDGILALLKPEHDQVAYTMFYRNADGSDAGMCGNGARCLAKFAHSLGFGPKHTFSVHDQIYSASVENRNSVTISFPMEVIVEEIEVDRNILYRLYTGTEHVVLPVGQAQLNDEDFLRREGRKFRHHPLFQPNGTNVNFISGSEKHRLRLQTFERGVEDLTLACGTGALASALAWHYIQESSEEAGKYTIETKGGILAVSFLFDSGTYANIKLEGPAHFVFEGKYLL